MWFMGSGDLVTTTRRYRARCGSSGDLVPVRRAALVHGEDTSLSSKLLWINDTRTLICITASCTRRHYTVLMSTRDLHRGG